MRYAKYHFSRPVKVAVSLCLTVLVCLQLAMAASETLHKLIHADADDPGHECAVTLFAHGQIETCAADVPAMVPVSWVDTTPQVICSFVNAALQHLPPGRGPPLPCPVS